MPFKASDRLTETSGAAGEQHGHADRWEHEAQNTADDRRRVADGVRYLTVENVLGHTRAEFLQALDGRGTLGEEVFQRLDGGWFDSNRHWIGFVLLNDRLEFL